jgi:hypothetical protein
MKNFKRLIFFTIICPGILYAQDKTNLDMFLALVDSSVSILPESIPEYVTVSVYTGNNYLLYNYIFGKINSRYTNVQPADSSFYLSYVLENVKLEYGDVFRKKFLGDYYIERIFNLDGNYVILQNNISQEFSYSITDTVKMDNLKSLENHLHPFTRGDIPPEPFFQGILEPVIALATAATAVVLFFVLRSK